MDVVDGQKWETIPSLLEQVASFDNQKHLADMAQGTRSLVFSTKLSNRLSPPDSKQFGTCIRCIRQESEWPRNKTMTKR